MVGFGRAMKVKEIIKRMGNLNGNFQRKTIRLYYGAYIKKSDWPPKDVLSEIKLLLYCLGIGHYMGL